ncbi:MAG: hypothetical protein KDC85_23995 [Saprospiraceae bacterium]|nr:hypothetical protein [Saprospiraceae bacterium]MCB9325544.1 hypothetical protein [Lewinellaceae bacterium]
MRNIKAFLLVLSLLATTGFYSCKTTSGPATSQTKTAVPTDPLQLLKVNYNSPWLGITVADKKITKVKTLNHFKESNFSSTPDSVSTEMLMDGVALSDSILNVLNKLIDEKKFWELEDNYGAPEGLRFYPYTISVERNEKIKTVTFRSNPSYGLAPSGFTAIQKFLEEMK